MEEENIPTKCHRQRTYTEDFIKSVVNDYETRKGEYASSSAYSREKGVPHSTLFGWLNKYGSKRQSAANERMAIVQNLRSAKKGGAVPSWTGRNPSTTGRNSDIGKAIW